METQKSFNLTTLSLSDWSRLLDESAKRLCASKIALLSIVRVLLLFTTYVLVSPAAVSI